MTPRKIHHLLHFGFSNFKGEDTDNGHALFVDSQHDLSGLRMPDAKEPLKNEHNKFHRRIVVIEQQHLIQRRPFGLWFRLDGKADISVVKTVVVTIRHHIRHALHAVVSKARLRTWWI